ncbi:contact-dependent growth inhibition system immunity protein [Mycolicibacterium vaccae]|uniref:contact-dependent growth inhibition system immunity protein n=1 Tax=Mycolicibacterium vaccae TaxID=1810 RepID=UPI003CF3146B
MYQFLATNFHQDWDLEAEDWQGIVDHYVDAVATPAPLLRLADEIDELRTSRPEPQLKEFLVRQVGVDYVPEPLTYGGWLEQIADRIWARVVKPDPGTGRPQD